MFEFFKNIKVTRKKVRLRNWPTVEETERHVKSLQCMTLNEILGRIIILFFAKKRDIIVMKVKVKVTQP